MATVFCFYYQKNKTLASFRQGTRKNETLFVYLYLLLLNQPNGRNDWEIMNKCSELVQSLVVVRFTGE